MQRGLFINNKKARDSIYESGYMVYKCLVESKKFILDYQEIDENDRNIKLGYDFYFFNYHPATMSWLQTRHLKSKLGFVITMILEVSPNDPFVLCPSTHFNLYCALDPTINAKHKNVYAFPRPLEKVDFNIPVVNNQVPIIGSFGFATRGKGFQHVVEAVNKEFDKAIVKINIPYGDFVPDSEQYAYFLGNLCKEMAKPGIEVQVTHDFMSKEELIKWCALNTLNCFLYDRKMPGLSATTDQAIVSGRPMSVSDNETFRHITSYLPPYPHFTLKDSIEKSMKLVNRMNLDWQPEKFQIKFEDVLNIYKLKNNLSTVGEEFYKLQVKENNILDTFTRKLKKYKRKIKYFNPKLIIAKKNNGII